MQSVPPIQSKLASIGTRLNDLAANLGQLIQQVAGQSPSAGRRPTSGPGSRLTDSERANVISMLGQPDRYTVQQIADKHRITRAAVYLIARTADLPDHKRGPWASQISHPLDRLMS